MSQAERKEELRIILTKIAEMVGIGDGRGPIKDAIQTEALPAICYYDNTPARSKLTYSVEFREDPVLVMFRVVIGGSEVFEVSVNCSASGTISPAEVVVLADKLAKVSLLACRVENILNRRFRSYRADASMRGMFSEYYDAALVEIGQELDAQRSEYFNRSKTPNPTTPQQ